MVFLQRLIVPYRGPPVLTYINIYVKSSKSCYLGLFYDSPHVHSRGVPPTPGCLSPETPETDSMFRVSTRHVSEGVSDLIFPV